MTTTLALGAALAFLGPTPQVTEPCDETSGSSVVSFADARLDGAVRSALSVGGDIELTCELIAGLDTLDADFAEIESLDGIQSLTGLEDLGLWGNSISDLGPLAGLTRLTRLNVGANSVTDVGPLAGLTNLTFLQIRENEITDVDALSGLTRLTYLDISYNDISDIGALSGLTRVEALRVYFNPLTDISAMRDHDEPGRAPHPRSARPRDHPAARGQPGDRGGRRRHRLQHEHGHLLGGRGPPRERGQGLGLRDAGLEALLVGARARSGDRGGRSRAPQTEERTEMGGVEGGGGAGKESRVKVAKVALIVVLAYAALVAAFETLLGLSQPSGQDTMVITTFEEDGSGHDRVVSRLEVGERVYVAANHWPRAWFRRVAANPRIEVTYGGETVPHVAVPLGDDERDAVDSAHPLGLVFRVLTGFPPRRILRLDPQ